MSDEEKARIDPNEVIRRYLATGDMSGMDANTVRQLYDGVASGLIAPERNQFDRLLFNNSDLKTIDRNEFAEMRPEVRQWAIQNPQAFVQSMLQHRNSANQDLASVGAEGGISSLSDLRVVNNGLDWGGTKYLDIHDGGLLGYVDPVTRSAISSTKTALDGGNIRDVMRSGRDSYREGIGEAIDAHQQLNRKAIRAVNDAQLQPLRWAGVSEKTLNNPYLNPERQVLAVESLGSGDARLANSTKNLNSGLFSKTDRVEATKKDQEGLQIIKQAGAMAAATGIPVVSWVGLLANGVANARLSEADIQSGRAGLTNFGSAYLGSVAQPATWYGQAGMGAARGGLNAYGTGGDVAQGALVGGVTSGMAGLGNWSSGMTGSNVGDAALQGGVNSAVTRGLFGGNSDEILDAAGYGAIAGGVRGAGNWSKGMTGSRITDNALRGGVNNAVMAAARGGDQEDIQNALMSGAYSGGTRTATSEFIKNDELRRAADAALMAMRDGNKKQVQRAVVNSLLNSGINKVSTLK